jgi:putative acyl-CoA dehydrogenase
MCLDVLRALRGEEERDLLQALAHDAGVERRDLAVEDPPNEAYARMTVERLALLASTAALRAGAPPSVTDQFVRTRLAGTHGTLYGTQQIDASAADVLLQRALPER